MGCENNRLVRNVPSNVLSKNQQTEVEDLQVRIRRILEHPNVPQELKQDFQNNNFIQLFEKNFGSILTEGGRR